MRLECSKMGKASKWIRNFLIGKKEEKGKKKDQSFSAENFVIPTPILPPKDKRRWSFGRSASTDTPSHKSTRSFDTIIAAQLAAQALFEYENDQNHAMAMVVATNEAAKTAVAATKAPARKPGPVEDAAATKIQAAFRSYLAKKALCALRGLVKLQALARGHLVRKQTTAMLRCMHTLMAIQVRARVQRIQMAEESEVIVKRRTTHRELPRDNQLGRSFCEMKDVKINEIRSGLKSKKDHTNHPQVETMENGFSTYYSKSLSISKQEHQLEIGPNPSPLTYMSSRASISFNTEQRSSQHYSTVSKFNHSPAKYEDPSCHDYQFEPNYMANTESSRAKFRSQSEPKQRPKLGTKPKGRRTASIKGMNVTEDIQTPRSSTHTRDNTQKKQHPWLIKLYRSTKPIKDTECDLTSMASNSSSYCNSLTAYEPAVNLY